MVEPKPTPPTLRFAEKRDAVLAAAAHAFNEEGVKGATLAGIAASVGLATNSVTYYYRKKEDLATACFRVSIAAFAAVAQDAAGHDTVAERVQAFVAAHAQLLADIEGGSRAPLLQFNDLRALPSPQVDAVFAAYTDMFRQVRALLRGPETAKLGRDALNARAHILLSVVLQLRLTLRRHELDAYPPVARHVADTLLHGLGAPGSRWQAQGLEADWSLAVGPAGPMDAFLRAATVLVNEQGYRGASVDRISAMLNVTKGSFYHHNDNKLDLITACFERSFQVMRTTLVQAEQAPGSGWARCGALARALVQHQLSAQGPLLRVSALSALPDAQQRSRVRTTLLRLTERLGGLVVAGMVDGSIRPMDPAVAAQGLIAAINAAAELQRWVPGVQAEAAHGLYVRPLFEGLLSGAD